MYVVKRSPGAIGEDVKVEAGRPGRRGGDGLARVGVESHDGRLWKQSWQDSWMDWKWGDLRKREVTVTSRARVVAFRWRGAPS